MRRRKPWLPFCTAILFAGTAHSEPPATNRLTVALNTTVSLDFCWIPPGRFWMGARDGEADERPVRQIEIFDGFWMSSHEITQAQYWSIMNTNPSSFAGPDLPVEGVSYEEAQNFLRRLLAQQVLPEGFLPRLPNEAEWEYACRAGSTTSFHCGDDPGDLPACAWFAANSGGRTQPTGQRLPNDFGLHDMHGNVWEWCVDWYYADYYGLMATNAANTSGPQAGWARVIRGGSWRDPASYCRAANRFRYRPWNSDYTVGFRVVLVRR